MGSASPTLHPCFTSQHHLPCRRRCPQAHLLEAALALAWDPVPNVRLHLAGALPALKGAVGLPDDVHLLELLNRWGGGMEWVLQVAGLCRLWRAGPCRVCRAGPCGCRVPVQGAP